MSSGTRGLRLIQGTGLSDAGTCYVSAATYPMAAPYHGASDDITGRVPRVISILLNTFVVRHHPDYNPRTHTLQLGRDWRTMYLRAGISGGGRGTERIRAILDTMSAKPIEKEDGTEVVPFTSLILPEQGTVGGEIVFDPEYVKMMTENPKPLPLNALAYVNRSGFTLDLLVLAALYCPDDRALIIRKRDLPLILPATSVSSYAPAMLKKRLASLNAGQELWEFSDDGGGLMISPRGSWTSKRDAVTLIRT